MQTRLTLRPGQSGTKKLVDRFGERLIRVRYLYDARTDELVLRARLRPLGGTLSLVR